jgi:RHH-type proline utilization regulon transcriptional repressor/proline dehydrogenase/delta 1-pyrroline-5-carboxylate dehydrogenase
MLTGRIMQMDATSSDLKGILKRLVTRSGEPVIRQAVTQAMKILGRQFVMGRDIAEALDRAQAMERKGYRYSYDMLGEAARTAHDADRYFESYQRAIAAIGKAAAGRGPIQSPGISV